MQAIIDWLMAHSAIVLFIVYELWSLIPEGVVKSSSILTLIGGFIKKPDSVP